MLPDDYALMNSVVAGDEAALRQLFDRHSPAVLAVCKRVVRDASDAEQVLIDVFWEIWKNRGNYVPQRSSPLTYLLMVARCRSIDRVRARKSRPAVSLEIAPLPADPGEQPLDGMIQSESFDSVQEALASLDPPQRDMIQYAFFSGMTYSEIAQELNKPLGTVKTQIRQALMRLRERVRRPSDKAASHDM
ncbi:MAG TPA: sigma-70 family RNA polymerase sigma factor [Tepidisphaeraceae bacterium]|jgi:RNA polymerase sigma-70 factor (ECF subfamily)